MRRVLISLSVHVIVLLSVCNFPSISSATVIPEIRVLVVSQFSATGFDTPFLTKNWQDHLHERFLRNIRLSFLNNNCNIIRMGTITSWPFNSTIEIIDCKSNATYMMKMINKRVSDQTLPKIAMISGPESKALSNPVASFCAAKGIPYVSYGSPELSYPRLPIYKSSFFIQPQYAYEYIELINAFVDRGVKTMVSVVMKTTAGNIAVPMNSEACSYGAQFAVTKGITLLKEIPLYFTNTRDDITDVVKSLRDIYKPDAVIWCDIYSVSPLYIDTYNPVKLFRSENYLPKALTLLDTLDSPGVNAMKAEGLYLYVTGATFVCNKVYGPSYTEGNHDYSSMFRPSGTISNIYDELNFGSTATSPSSAKLFYAWYKRVRGYNANRFALTVWAGFDVMEAAMYRASKVAANLDDGKISSTELLTAMKYMQLTTPHGPIQFDDNGDNIAYNSIVVQAFSITDTAEVVYPASARTADMVYPMPTWDERVYNWSLIDDNNVRISIIVASVCSFVILAIAITVVIHRREPEIRMLSYFHILLMCIAGLVVIWSLVFLWQRDNRPLQCGSFMWAVFLPASFMVQLVNIKAYRLSLFLMATANGIRPKPFSHMKTLRIVVSLLLISVILLGIIQAVDPPERSLHVNDVYRPKLDEYQCVFGIVGSIVLYLFVVGHVVFSAFCIAAVRNGMEDFRDGMIMKESFLLLYICLAVAFIMSNLGLSHSIAYLLRTVILSMGITLFIFRFLGSRVLPFWIPETWRLRLSMLHEKYIKPLMLSMNISTISHVSKSHMLSNMMNDGEDRVVDFDSPVYKKEAPKDENLQEMLNVLKDPKRKKAFIALSKETHAAENVGFLCEVMEYEEKCKVLLSTRSASASDEMREEALKIFNTYVNSNSENEVNLSGSCRKQVITMLSNWLKHTSIISDEDAKRLLEADSLKRSKVLEAAFHEISIMTYQNLWNKFRVSEATFLAMGQDHSPVEDIE